jgi:hypothetical protein
MYNIDTCTVILLSTLMRPSLEKHLFGIAAWGVWDLGGRDFFFFEVEIKK